MTPSVIPGDLAELRSVLPPAPSYFCDPDACRPLVGDRLPPPACVFLPSCSETFLLLPSHQALFLLLLVSFSVEACLRCSQHSQAQQTANDQGVAVGLMCLSRGCACDGHAECPHLGLSRGRALQCGACGCGSVGSISGFALWSLCRRMFSDLTLRTAVCKSSLPLPVERSTLGWTTLHVVVYG